MVYEGKFCVYLCCSYRVCKCGCYCKWKVNYYGWLKINLIIWEEDRFGLGAISKYVRGSTTMLGSELYKL